MSRPSHPLPIAALALLLLAPVTASAGGLLLDEELSLAPAPDLAVDERIAVRVALATAQGEGTKQDATKPAPGSLDFDLLGEAKAPAGGPDQKALKRRRTMLNWHQAVGFGLVGLHLGTTVTGQLNFNDKFGGSAPANTDKYRATHAVFSYATLAVFAANGTLAFLAPSPVKQERKWDRVMLHRIAMFTAAAGMATQAGLGIYTASREGYINQEKYAKAHLVVGYVTLAALSAGVGALVF